MDYKFNELPKRLLDNIFNSLNEGVILVNTENKVIFFNTYLKNFLEIYNFENLEIRDILKVSKKDQLIDFDKICPPGEFITNGLVFSERALFIETFSKQTKLVKISTFKYKEFYENKISCLILISDDSKEQELEKMKIDFASQSVHILRTPVSIMRNNLDFLKRENFQSKLTDQEKEFIKGLAEGADRLQNIVETMISVNEIQNEKIRLIQESTNLFSLTREVIKEVNEDAQNKSLKIYLIEPLYNLPNLRIDSLKIYDVIKSIIKNSIKFTDKGEITITFDKNEKYISLSIKDTGKGIPEIGLKNLFNKFYHYKSSALNMSEGLGLGLYICKKIIEAHGGEIVVDSTENIGTKVTLRFPISLSV